MVIICGCNITHVQSCHQTLIKVIIWFIKRYHCLYLEWPLRYLYFSYWKPRQSQHFGVLAIPEEHIGRGSMKYQYVMDGQELDYVNEVTDLGVQFTADLKPSKQCQLAYTTASRVLGMIGRTVSYKSREVMLSLYKSLVRPHLEFCISAWYPYYNHKSLVKLIWIKILNHKFTKWFKSRYTNHRTKHCMYRLWNCMSCCFYCMAYTLYAHGSYSQLRTCRPKLVFINKWKFLVRVQTNVAYRKAPLPMTVMRRVECISKASLTYHAADSRQLMPHHYIIAVASRTPQNCSSCCLVTQCDEILTARTTTVGKCQKWLVCWCPVVVQMILALENEQSL